MSGVLYVAARMADGVPLSERKFHILEGVDDGSALCGWKPLHGWFARFRRSTLSMVVCRECQAVLVAPRQPGPAEAGRG